MVLTLWRDVFAEQSLGVGSEDTYGQTGICMNWEAWGHACLWLLEEEGGWFKGSLEQRLEGRQDNGEQVGVSLSGAGPK